MALTIAIEGLGVIANADAETNDTGGDGTGDWGFNGSGGVSNGLTTDTFYYGSASMSMALSGAGKNGWLYFDRGGDLDFTTTLAGQYVYIWVHCPTLGLSETLANVGLGIRMGSSTGNYRTWTIAGNDDSNGWDGKWKCFVIDPTTTGSISDTGTYDGTDVNLIGIKGETTATAKGDNFFVSQIAVGSGLRITGTSTTGWEDLVDYCTDLPNRAWGMMQQREGIYYAYGDFLIGDTGQSANVSFEDSNRVVQFGVSEYWISSAWATTVDASGFGIVVEDHASWTTTFTDGIIVGSEEGRAGSTFIGGANEDIHMDLYGGNNAASVTALYGTKLQSLTGAIMSGNDADHKFLSVSFIACSQFDPVGAPLIRNCLFAETADVDSAILWNENIDIEDCTFIANTLGAAIEHPSAAGTPYDYTNLTFSGNTNDGLNSSGTDIVVNKLGTSNPINDEGGNTITYDASYSVTFDVQDEAKDPIENAQMSVYLLDSPFTEIMNEDTLSSGVATQGYSGSVPVDIKWRGRKSETADNPRYISQSGTGQITTNGFSLTVTMKVQNKI